MEWWCLLLHEKHIVEENLDILSVRSCRVDASKVKQGHRVYHDIDILAHVAARMGLDDFLD